jgi:peroxiredoxin
MSIHPGDTLPEALVQTVGDEVGKTDTRALFEGRKIVLFAVPGAFTPTCSEQHLPSYITHFDEFRRRGVDVACMAVNDPFVLKAWRKDRHMPAGMLLLADGNADFTRALGLSLDASGYGMGTRAQRFALYADNGVVKALEVEAPGEYRVSSAEHMLGVLDRLA